MEITLTKKHIATAIAAFAVFLLCICLGFFLWMQAQCLAPGSCGQGLPPRLPPQPEPLATEFRQEKTPSSDWGEDIPSGGLGSEELRRDVWRSLQTVVSCPDAKAVDVYISPLDDMSETWDVWCPDGSVDSYIVFYKDNPNGGIDFAIGKLKEE